MTKMRRKTMVNKDRLSETFKYLVEIDSVSREEGEFAKEIKKVLESMGAKTFVDSAGEKTGSDTGNLVAKFKGNVSAPSLLINAHMDTVQPGKGIKAVLKNGIFTSDGSTILGADDKSSIAVILESLRVLKENGLQYGPIDLVLTICEEIGLLGAKHFDLSLIDAKFGYALDATDVDGIIVRAPAANRLEFKIHGKDSHAGAAPEKGINAILLASKAIAGLEIGRIDRETTCNIGIIEGGIATNIVPKLVTVKGEVRSHDNEKLAKVTDDIVSSFKDVVENFRKIDSKDNLPSLEVSIEKDFPSTDIPEDHPVVAMAVQAGKNLGRKIVCKASGGGADANIFFETGIITGVLGTGMRDMHTVREHVKLDDMVKATELLIEIIKLHANS
jgi:tripeptide aminopeptidase